MTEIKSLKSMVKNLKAKTNALQQTLASRLSVFESRISVRQKKLFLVLFCFLFGFASIYVVVATLTRRFSSADLPVAPGSIPYHIGRSFRKPGAVIDSETYSRVEGFKHFLDSLKVHHAGRYTEIMNTRPHLYDSIIAFENIYILQLKK